MGFSTLPEAVQSPEGATLTALVVGSALKFLWLRHVRCVREQLFTFVGNVSELCVYPVKGCGAVELQSATATTVGLDYIGYADRQWMIEDCDTGNYMVMKECPQLTLLRSKIDGDWLTLTAPEMTPLRIPRKPDPAKFKRKSIMMLGNEVEVLDCGTEASDWLSRFLRHPVRLLHSRPEIGSRDAYDMPLPWETDARRGDKVTFAYLTSYLLSTTASLDDLNRRLDSPVTSRHFRPNIVVSTSLPFDEDNWEEVRIGTFAKFHFVQPCRRCIITTVKPDTGTRRQDTEPLATLRKYRKKDPPYGPSPLFGVYIALDNAGPINVGDPVYAIRRKTSL